MKNNSYSVNFRTTDAKTLHTERENSILTQQIALKKKTNTSPTVLNAVNSSADVV